MGYDVVFDANVELAGDYALLEQILLGAVGPEAHDASGPTAGHTGDLQQLIDGSVIDVDARLGRWGGGGCGWDTVGIAILILCLDGREATEDGNGDKR